MLPLSQTTSSSISNTACPSQSISSTTSTTTGKSLTNIVTPLVSLTASPSNKATQSTYTQNTNQKTASGYLSNTINPSKSGSFQTTITPTQNNLKATETPTSTLTSTPPVISQSVTPPPSIAYVISWSGEYKPTDTLSPTPYVNKTIIYNTSQESYVETNNNSDWQINYMLYGLASSLLILIPSYIAYTYICNRKKITRPTINIPVSRENPLLSSSQLQQRRRSISLESINKKNKASPTLRPSASPMLRSSTSPMLTSMPDSPV